MAHCRAQLPVHCPAQELDRLIPDLVRSLGLQVELQGKSHDWLVASEPPHQGLKPREHVMVLCDWSNLSNTGELAIEARSGESMAQSRTRAQMLFQQLCQSLTSVS